MSEPSTTDRVGLVARAFGLLVGGWAVTLGLVTAAGFAVTSYADDVPLLESEDAVNRDFVGLRTPTWDSTTAVLSYAGDTSFVAPAALVLALVLRWVLHRWRESLFLGVSVAGHWAVFLTTTMLVERERPDVPMLDEAPATSSFPSGHTGAALALYGALTVLVLRRVQTRWIKIVSAVALLGLPVLVATARLYRGMHYPSDLAGSVLSSGLVVLIAYFVVLRGHSRR